MIFCVVKKKKIKIDIEEVFVDKVVSLCNERRVVKTSNEFWWMYDCREKLHFQKCQWRKSQKILCNVPFLKIKK